MDKCIKCTDRCIEPNCHTNCEYDQEKKAKKASENHLRRLANLHTFHSSGAKPKHNPIDWKEY
jgi:hypothetical protein